MHALANEVRYRIVRGPDWKQKHNYEGEVMKFYVMKEASAWYGRGLSSALLASESLEIQVDHIVATAYSPRSFIQGKVVNEVQYGDVGSSSRDEIGLSFLRPGVSLEIQYDITECAGYVHFSALNSPSQPNVLLMVKNSHGQLSLMQATADTGEFHTYLELSHYAILRPEFDVRVILQTEDLEHYAAKNICGSCVDESEIQQALVNCNGIPIIQVN